MTKVKVIGTVLYQWELGRRLQITPLSGTTVTDVHFSNPNDKEALVVKPKEVNGMIVADIPNILLQSGESILAYTVDVSADCVETIRGFVFPVVKRPKPSDYVYTETEVLNYSSLDKRLKDLEGEGLSKAVSDYLKDNPVQAGATAEEAAQIAQNKQDIETLKKFTESDPTVPEWAKQPEKPTYTADEVGAQIADFVVTFSLVDGEYVADKTFNETKEAFNSGRTITARYDHYFYDLYSDGGGEGFGFIDRDRCYNSFRMMWLWDGDSVSKQDGNIYINHPVESVNGKTGKVQLSASDVGALPDTTKIPTVPTKVSAFTNDSGYQTAEQVTNAINTALGVIENGTY